MYWVKFKNMHHWEPTAWVKPSQPEILWKRINIQLQMFRKRDILHPTANIKISNAETETKNGHLEHAYKNSTPQKRLDKTSGFTKSQAASKSLGNVGWNTSPRKGSTRERPRRCQEREWRTILQRTNEFWSASMTTGLRLKWWSEPAHCRDWAATVRDWQALWTVCVKREQWLCKTVHGNDQV